jgi:hypothetical protein
MEVAFGSNDQGQVRGQFNGQDYITQQVRTPPCILTANLTISGSNPLHPHERTSSRR